MGQEPKILIVDDDPGERESLELVLKTHGYKISTAMTGHEGIKKATQDFFHFALVDKRLPDLSGTEVLKTIKKSSPQTEVALITGYASVESAIEAIDADAVAYLEKPLDLDRVLSTIAQALQRQHRVQEQSRRMEELERQKDLLESEVLQTQARLVAMERKAYVGEFVAQMVHEIRNPLSTIKVSLQVLAEKNLSLDANDKRRLDLALKKMADLESLLNDMLDFTRPIPSHKEPVEINSEVEKTLALIQDAAEQRQVRVERRLGLSPLFAQVDRSRFQQAILNLCLNAIQSIPESTGGILSVKTSKAILAEPVGGGKPRKWVQIDIRDNGSGMSPETLNRVFHPFFTTRKSGTGLGLPMVRKFVYEHDGLIHLSSHPGEGTTVSLFLANIEVPNGKNINHR